MDTEQLKQFVRSPFAWPGGYPLFAITTDGGCLCHSCTKEHYRLIRQAQRDNDNTGWNVAAIEVNWENDSLECDHCNKSIESAYGEDN